MNKLISVLMCLLLIPAIAQAKEGKLKLGKHIVFQGNVENKTPRGKGELYLKKDDVPFLTGNFNNNVVIDAELSVKDIDFTGNFHYTVFEDKKSEKIIEVSIPEGSKMVVANGSNPISMELLDDLVCYFCVDKKDYYYGINKEYIHMRRVLEDREIIYSSMTIPTNNRKLSTFKSELNQKSRIHVIRYDSGRKVLETKYKTESGYTMRLRMGLDWYYLGEFDLDNPTAEGANYVYKKTNTLTYSGNISKSGLTDGEVEYSNGETFTGTFYVKDNDEISYFDGVQKKESLSDTWKGGHNVSEQNRLRRAELIAKIEEGYEDPALSLILGKTYVYIDKSNVAMGGRACWKNDFNKVSFSSKNVYVEESGFTINIINAYGGDGETLYEKKKQPVSISYIMDNDVIYTWQYDDYSDLGVSYIYDRENDVIKNKDKTMTLRAR